MQTDPLPCGARPCKVSALGNQVWTGPDGVQRLTLVTAAEPVDVSHVSSATLGIAVLRHGPRGWEIEAGSPAVDQLGAFGKLPPIEIIDAGAFGRGVVAHSADMHQGHGTASNDLYLNVAGHVRKVLEITTEASASGACAPGDQLCTSGDFTSTVSIMVSGDGLNIEQKITSRSPSPAPSLKRWHITLTGKVVPEAASASR
jgi:hypothetical protein